MSKKSFSKTSEAVGDFPEITQADLDQARFRVNLKDVPRKQRINIMLDTAVIAYFKSMAGSRGYQTLINETLKKAINQETLEATLRRVIREETKPA
jgi:uncharacterized protein (DUF4415 family)